MKNSSVLDNISPTDTISIYIAEATRIPLLTHREEKHLMQQIERARLAAKALETSSVTDHRQKNWQELYQEGERARSQLITANTRLVIYVAQKYRGMGIPLSDLIQEGNLGLIRAIESFDYRRGTRFATYATWWIRQGILRSLTYQSRAVRLPRHLQGKYREIQTFIEDYERDNGERPSHHEISLILGISEFVVYNILTVSQPAKSLNYIFEDGDTEELQDFVSDDSRISAHRMLSMHELTAQIQDVLNILPSRQARILTLRYGLFGTRPHSRNEIGEKIGLNRERIRQLEIDALRKIRFSRYANQLVSYLE